VITRANASAHTLASVAAVGRDRATIDFDKCKTFSIRTSANAGSPAYLFLRTFYFHFATTDVNSNVSSICGLVAATDASPCHGIGRGTVASHFSTINHDEATVALVAATDVGAIDAIEEVIVGAVGFYIATKDINVAALVTFARTDARITPWVIGIFIAHRYRACASNLAGGVASNDIQTCSTFDNDATLGLQLRAIHQDKVCSAAFSSG